MIIAGSKKQAVPGARSDKGSSNDSAGVKLPVVGQPANNSEDASSMDGFSVVGTSARGAGGARKGDLEDDTDVDRVENRALKPPPSFGNDAELKQLATIISRDIYQESPNVRFPDIIGLDEAKRFA